MTEATPLPQRVAQVMPGVIDDLTRLVAIPSCAFPGFPAEPVLAAAEATVDWLRRSGVADARTLEVPDGYPVVYGEIAGPPGAPTVLLYAHYDVQPAPAEQGWTVDPWQPQVRDGRLFGRGAADDKSGIAIHAAVLQAFGGRPPVGIRVVVEGEEETESHLDDFVRDHPDLFASDVYVIADGGNEQVGVPVLEVTTRGAVFVEVEVTTLEQPVHSGIFGGGAPDALMALVRLLATLHDDRGDVAVPGLFAEEWVGGDTDEDLLRTAAGIVAAVPLVGSGRLASRLWSKPSISVIGLDAPPTEGAVNALVPKARALVSMRIPPGAEPQEQARLLAEHLVAATPWGVQLTVGEPGAWEGWRTREDGPVIAAAREAMAAVYGKPVGLIGSGGSIPLLTTLQRLTPDAEFVLWGAEDGALANIHSADESVDLAELERAATAEALLLEALGKRSG